MKRIIFFGDSNTFGYDPRAIFGGRYSEDIRWTDIVARDLADALEVVPRGMNGRCIPRSEYEIEALEKLIKAFAPLDYFAIMLGTNDVLLTDNPRPAEAIENMRCLLERLNKHVLAAEGAALDPENTSAGFEILLIIPPLMFPGTINHSPFWKYEEASKRLAEGYRGIAEELGLRTIDASNWMVDLDVDGVHISERGSLDFAEHMKAALLEIMG